MEPHRLLGLFLSEGRDLIGRVDAELCVLESRPGARESLDAVFRAVHSLKGMSATVGLTVETDALDAAESRLVSAREAGEIEPSDLRLLFELTAALRDALNAVEQGDASPEAVGDVMRHLLARTPGAGGAELQAGLAQATVFHERTRSVRVPAERLDELLDLIGELVTVRDRLMRVVPPEADAPARVAAEDAARLITRLRDAILTSRMVPLAQVFDRFARHVRDVAATLGREVDITFDGRDLEVDRSLLDEVSEAVLHLLRNAIDHGIEPPRERVASGKPRRGALAVRARREGDMLAIEVADDGRGVDRAAVACAASALDIPDAETLAATDTGLLRLLARPGLSTRRDASSLSGRGVGMDAVQHRVQAIGGRLELATADGAGTTVTLRLPLSVAILRALLVRVDTETYAIPMTAVHSTRVHRAPVPGASCVPSTIGIGDETLPLIVLRTHLGGAGTDDVSGHLVVVEGSSGRRAVLVDACTTQCEIVVKPLQAVRGAATLFSGGTILADGTPSLILDINSLP